MLEINIRTFYAFVAILYVVQGKNALVRAALTTDENYLFPFISICCPFHFPKQLKSFLGKKRDFFI